MLTNLIDEINETSTYRLVPTNEFLSWLKRVEKKRIFALNKKIEFRFRCFAEGQWNNSKSVGHGVFESRVFGSPAVRIYYGFKNGRVVMLLMGGGKDSQDIDIKKAYAIAKREHINVK